jgi:hypothetical protein
MARCNNDEIPLLQLPLNILILLQLPLDTLALALALGLDLDLARFLAIFLSPAMIWMLHHSAYHVHRVHLNGP